MKVYIINFDPQWCASHAGAAVSPLERAAQAMEDAYTGHISVSTNGNSVVCTFDLDKGVNCSKIYAVLKDCLGADYPDFTRRTVEIVLKESTGEASAPDETASTAAKESREAEVDWLTELSRSMTETIQSQEQVDAPKENANSQEGRENNTVAEKILEEIRGLITGHEFKRLAEELFLVAPQVRAHHSSDIIISQTYLFSIGDGCGLYSYLELLRDLLNALEMPDLHLESDIIMGKIPATSDRPGGLADKFLFNFTENRRRTHIVCADISEWMKKVNGAEFRDILAEFLKLRHGDIIVFSVPFVDKEVLENITLSLNDLLFVRKLTFPPLTTEEIDKFAEKEIGRFGFTMEAEAYPNFRRRIAVENSDGRFHGIETVYKVVYELLYQKQIDNATNKTLDTVIHSADTAKLLTLDIYDDDLTGMQMLDKMVGTGEIKTKILEIISQIKFAKQNAKLGVPCIHMRFLGNPGTGKTTVARIIGKILKENGILRIGEFHEHSGRDFCGRYIGETAPKTSGICRDAYGSVLFIDEAYSLYRGDSDSKDFGREALDTLIAEMENHRDDMVVIMAGYTDEMERLMKGNVGLQSRMPYSLFFPNFTREQLYEIFLTMVEGKVEYEPEVLELAKKYLLGLNEDWVKSKDFSNGRFVRNLFERCCAKAAMRCQLAGAEKIVLSADDFNRSISDKDFLTEKKVTKRSPIGFGN